MSVRFRDSNSNVEDRRNALLQLAGRKRAELKSELVGLLDSEGLRRDIIRAMAAFDEASMPQALLALYSSFTDGERQEAIYTLSSRNRYAQELTSALIDQRISKRAPLAICWAELAASLVPISPLLIAGIWSTC